MVQLDTEGKVVHRFFKLHKGNIPETMTEAGKKYLQLIRYLIHSQTLLSEYLPHYISLKNYPSGTEGKRPKVGLDVIIPYLQPKAFY
jgi:hypothetical protein